MHIRSYDEEAKYLGFKDENEMNLYYDVCGVDIVPAYTREDMLSQCTVGNETLGRTKEDFINYMIENELVDLYYRVKDLSMLDRLLELYRYNMNGLVLSDSVLKMYNKELFDAIELSDGEKYLEYSEKLNDMMMINYGYDCRANNNKRSAALRLGYIERDIFFSNSEQLEFQRESLLNSKGRGKNYK